ncbi:MULTISPECIES: DSD1 family PLP-dependent enzyme [unclassified Achromobacter]|uniref:DSD1 family PLP-dependent enzyme n=1 Tax=unclassified Achromobacter TaxID=2626865 RepID=UPI000B51E50E|nr:MULTISPECIES: DSD1 family PLP-dependent enzyme [unclassified Achromobacter]OWT74305.1 alanine racemase [Achromobacter sp. HZ34]OWT78772.1 alanine racemase [Achromobacter sp. HZ28]
MHLSALDAAPYFDRPSAPAEPGMPVTAIDTPALLLDLAAMEHNIALVHAGVHDSGLALRPHAKAHKCVELALRQMQAGAAGICCQKVSEAEIFVRGGVPDVLITNQIVGAEKCHRVAQLAMEARIAVCVDHPDHVRDIAEAARAQRVNVDVLIEVDIGQGRCGIANAGQALSLARAIGAQGDCLSLRGLHAFSGRAQHLRQPREREQDVAQASVLLNEILGALRAAGHACATVTGGGTGTYALEGRSGIYTEVQPGSYVLMDADYAANVPAPQQQPLRQALLGLCTVISARNGRAVLDGGLKTFAVDRGLPRVLRDGWQVTAISDEHIVLQADTEAAARAAPLAVGDRVLLQPGHCDPTVNLHDWLVAIRDEVVEDVWPIDARGALR